MSTETKRFSLRTVLTSTTGRLLTETDEQHPGNGIGWLHELLGWMTGDEPFTHSLPRFNDECKPWLLRWFPELGRADVDLLDDLMEAGGPVEAAIETFIAACIAAGMKAEYDVPRIPAEDHERKDPIAELVEMVGPEKVVVAVVPSSKGGE